MSKNLKAISNGTNRYSRSKFKDHKFIGEETTSANDDNVDEFTDDPTWIIDPVDGTMNFVHG